MLNEVCILTGMIALWCNYDLMQTLLESRPLAWMAQFTFFVYALHRPLMPIVAERFVYPFCKEDEGIELLLFFLLPALTIVLCAGIASVMKRFSRPVYIVLSGAR